MEIKFIECHPCKVLLHAGAIIIILCGARGMPKGVWSPAGLNSICPEGKKGFKFSKKPTQYMGVFLVFLKINLFIFFYYYFYFIFYFIKLLAFAKGTQ